jgi:hypothetical protein
VIGGPLIGFAIAIAITSVVAFFLVGKFAPATDDPKFASKENLDISHNRIVINRVCRGGSPFACEEQRLVTRRKRIEVSYPTRVPVQNDFQVTFEYTAMPDLIPSGNYSAALHFPKYVEARTTRKCAGSSAVDSEVSACERPESASPTITFIWDATPTKTGIAYIAITSDVIGTLSVSTGPPSETSIEVTAGADHAEIPVGRVAASNVGSAVVDMTNKEIRFPIEVLTTVGVSQQTYDRITSVGAVVTALGTLFGAGFALKILQKKKKSDDFPT